MFLSRFNCDNNQTENCLSLFSHFSVRNIQSVDNSDFLEGYSFNEVFSTISSTGVCVVGEILSICFWQKLEALSAVGAKPKTVII